MYKDMKKFMANAKKELDEAYKKGDVEDIQTAAVKIVNISAAMIKMSLENIYEN